MSLRFASLDQLGKGAWKISKATPFGASAPPLAKPAASTTLPNGSAKPAKATHAGPMPHDILWDAIAVRWPQAEREFKGAVPARRFRIDVAFPDVRLALEVDGYQHHGRYLADFKKDRCRQNLLTLHGWRILRFSAGEIRQDLTSCLSMIEATLQSLSGH